MSNGSTTLDERISTLSTGLHQAAHLIGEDWDSVDPEYIRGVVEMTCDSTGIGTHNKELVHDLLHNLVTDY